MGEEQVLAERGAVARCRHLGRKAAQRTHEFQIPGAEDQRHQGRAQRGDGEAETARRLVGEAGGAQLGDREPARCQHQRRRGDLARPQGQHVAAVVGDVPDALAHAQLDAGIAALAHQHVDDLSRRAVAEELAQGLLVPGDAMAVDQGDEVVLGVAGQRGPAEIGIGGKEPLRPHVEIGEVAPSAAGDQDLAAGLAGMVEQQDPPPPASRCHRADQPRRPRADDHRVESLARHRPYLSPAASKRPSSRDKVRRSRRRPYQTSPAATGIATPVATSLSNRRPAASSARSP